MPDLVPFVPVIVAVVAAGSAITIALLRRRPARSTRPPPVAPTPPPPRASRPSLAPRRRVLVVDDERSMAIGIVRLLVDAIPGVDAEHAQSGEEAAAMVRASPVDVLVVDVALRGGMSGPELVRRLREEGHVFRALVISGMPAEDLEHVAADLDARWWEKGGDPDALLETVRELLR